MKKHGGTQGGSLMDQLMELEQEARRRIREKGGFPKPGEAPREAEATVCEPASEEETAPESVSFLPPPAVSASESGQTLPETTVPEHAPGRSPSPPPGSGVFRRGDFLADTYRVESDPITGGMGAVWRVHHMGWGADLAMKRPKAELFRTEQQKQVFRNECDAWIGLGLHPNIVSCYYVRELDGTPSIFSEWMDAGSLKNAIENGTLYAGDDAAQQERILDIAIQFARGLHYAHENGLIHQDVKPDNLLLNSSGEAKAADFGIARARAALTVLDGTVTAAEAGGTVLAQSGGYTPAYCSMEQMDGRPLTRRTDIYSWAVTVMEMYAGKRVWSNGVVAGLGAEDYLSDVRVLPSGAMKQLLLRCLRSEPEERPHDFGIIEEELLNIYRTCVGRGYPRSAPRAAADTAESLNNRALSYVDLGMERDALALWEQALEKLPDYPEAVFNRELYLWSVGKAEIPSVRNRLADLAVRVPAAGDWPQEYEELLAKDFPVYGDTASFLYNTRLGLKPLLCFGMRDNLILDAGGDEERLLLRSRKPGSQDCSSMELTHYQPKRKWNLVAGAFSRDGTQLAVAVRGLRKKEYFISVYDTETGKRLNSYPAGSQEHGYLDPEGLELSPDCQYLCWQQSLGEDGTAIPHILRLSDGSEQEVFGERLWGFLNGHDPVCLKDGHAWLYSMETGQARRITSRRLRHPRSTFQMGRLTTKELISFESFLSDEPELFDRSCGLWRKGCPWIADSRYNFSVTMGRDERSRAGVMLFWDRSTGRNTAVVNCSASHDSERMSFDGSNLILCGHQKIGGAGYDYLCHQTVTVPVPHWEPKPLPYKLSGIASVNERLASEQRFLDCCREFDTAAEASDWSSAVRIFREAQTLAVTEDESELRCMYDRLLPVCRKTGIRRVSVSEDITLEKLRDSHCEIFGNELITRRDIAGLRYYIRHVGYQKDWPWPSGVTCYDILTGAKLWSAEADRGGYIDSRPFVSRSFVMITLSSERVFLNPVTGRQMPVPDTYAQALAREPRLKKAFFLDLSESGDRLVFSYPDVNPETGKPEKAVAVFSFADGSVQDTGDRGLEIEASFLRDGSLLCYTLNNSKLEWERWRHTGRHLDPSGRVIESSFLNVSRPVRTSPSRKIFYGVEDDPSIFFNHNYGLLFYTPQKTAGVLIVRGSHPPMELFSEDERWLLFWPSQGPLRFLDTASRSVIYSTELQHNQYKDPLFFTEDGQYILCCKDGRLNRALRVEYELELP